MRVVARSAVSALALALFGCESGGGGSDGTTSPQGGGDTIGGSSPDGGGAPTGTSAKLECNGHGCGVKQLALGTIAACALLEDGTVACYGGGIVGTLGHGAEHPEVDPVPKRVANMKNVAKVFGGGYSMCAVLTDRTVTCWGADQSLNPYGARPGDVFTVEGLSNVVELAVATSHTCALVEGGDVHCFGSNYFGELGDGTTDNSKKAVKVKGISGAKAIATGAEMSCAVLANGSISCWGMNDMGQLGQGNGDKLIHPDPVTVPGLAAPAKSVAASSVSGAVCALLENGATKCWGEKLAGAPATTGGAALAVGWNHACALDGAGAVSCWGTNTKGQLGNGSNAAAAAATNAAGISGAMSLATGGNSSCSVFADGSFACWGDDSRGQLGAGQKGTVRPTPQKTHF
jgi:alpha-tubulin suppressor-like RCC1 family protein